jgi:hypothetical protein
MSGIFVDENDTFDITAYCQEKDGKVEVNDQKKEGGYSLTITFKHPDFITSQNIINSCMERADGNSSISFVKLRTTLIYFLATKWDAKDKKGNPVELNGENIGKMRNEIVGFFIQRVQDKVGSDVFAA